MVSMESHHIESTWLCAVPVLRYSCNIQVLNNLSRRNPFAPFTSYHLYHPLVDIQISHEE